MSCLNRIVAITLCYTIASGPLASHALAANAKNDVIGGYCITGKQNLTTVVEREEIKKKVYGDLDRLAPKMRAAGTSPEHTLMATHGKKFVQIFTYYCGKGLETENLAPIAAATTGNAFTQQDGIQSAAIDTAQKTHTEMKTANDKIEKDLQSVNVEKIAPKATNNFNGELIALFGSVTASNAKRTGLYWNYLRLLRAEEARFKKLEGALQGNSKKVKTRQSEMSSISDAEKTKGVKNPLPPSRPFDINDGTEVSAPAPPIRPSELGGTSTDPNKTETTTTIPEEAIKNAEYTNLQTTSSDLTTNTATSTSNFFSENKNALLVGGAVLAAGGVGLWAYNKNQKDKKADRNALMYGLTSTSTSASTSTSTSSSTSSSTSTSTSTSTSVGITGKAKSLRVTGYPPQRAIMDQTINPVTVQLMTADGTPDTSSGVTITVSCTKSCALVGVTTKTTANGSVSFTDLRFGAVSSGTQLIFNSPGMNASASTGSFRVEAE